MKVERGHLIRRFLQHFAAARQQCHELDFIGRRLPSLRCHELLDLSVDLFPAPGAASQNIFRNAPDLKARDLALVGSLHLDLITEPDALLRQGILIGLSGIPDRTIHFRGIQSFERAVGLLRHIHNYIVRMELRIEQTAGVMMILGVDELPRISEVFRRKIGAATNADGGKPFQLPHPDFDRFPVRFNQARIEQ